MTKKPPARRRTLNQLKVAAWPDRTSAVRDLKISGVPAHGEDYELGEHKPGSWMLLPLNPPDEVVFEEQTHAEPEAAPIREDRVLDSLRKKPGAPPKGTPKVIAEAKAPKGKPGVAKANGNAVKLPAPLAEPPPDPAALQSLFNDVVEELAGEAAGDEAPAEPAVEPAAKPPRFDLSPLPASGGPYEIAIRAADGSFPNNGAVTYAVTFSRMLKVPVHVRNPDGDTVRTVDVAAMKAAEKASRIKGAAGRPAGSFGRPKSGESKFDRAAKLLFRDKGATAKELAAIWPDVGQRHINRASRLNNDARIEKLGDQHWRLVKA